MKKRNFGVYWSDGTFKEFKATEVDFAYISALSYEFEHFLDGEISFIVDDENGEVIYDLQWIVEFKQKVPNTTINEYIKITSEKNKIKLYTEEEVRKIMVAYQNYIGNGTAHVSEYFEKIVKVKK